MLLRGCFRTRELLRKFAIRAGREGETRRKWGRGLRGCVSLDREYILTAVSEIIKLSVDALIRNSRWACISRVINELRKLRCQES